MSQNDQRWKPKQLAAIRCLAAGLTIDETSEEIGTHERTIDVWLKIEGFREAINSLALELHDAKIKQHLASTESVGKQLRELSEILLEKSLQWANDIQLSEMSHGNAIKAIAETRALISDSHYLLDSALGIEKLRQTYLNEND